MTHVKGADRKHVWNRVFEHVLDASVLVFLCKRVKH
jgi:hypothetical protein